MNIQNYITKCQKRIKPILAKTLPPANEEPRDLHKAMRYAVLNGGKRLRAALIYATGEAFGAKLTLLNNLCAAMEMIHACSLVHDDLPALDNDDLRRGKATCHKVFGEATAILAGDALQSLAFEILSTLNKKNKKSISPAIEVEMVRLFAHVIGSRGIMGGEDLDLKMTHHRITLRKLEIIYQLKTGALLTGCILLGALAGNCRNKKTLHNLTKFSECIGLAFQIHDDIIGIESDTKTLGKSQGIDAAKKKPVYPIFVGMKKAKQKEKMLYRKALSYLDKTGINFKKLKDISAYMITRSH